MKVDLAEIKEYLEMFDVFKDNSSLIAKEIQNTIHKDIYNNWKKLAMENLHSTRNIYLQGLSADENGVHLQGELPNALENGMPAYDMKRGFSLSPKRKITASGGWYLVVPFRILTPNAVGGGNKFTRTQYNAAKAGLNIPDSVLPKPKTREGVYSGSQYFPAYTAKTSSMTGIVSSPATNGKQQYNTFRVVSSKSDPASWIHKGTKEYNLGDKALDMTNFDEIIDDVINRLI